MTRGWARAVTLLGAALLGLAVAVPSLPHAATVGGALVGSLLVSFGVLALDNRAFDPHRRRLVRVGAVLVALQLTGLARAFRVGVVHPGETARRQATGERDDVLTNPRLANRQLSLPRGRIAAADGTVLARSRSSDAGFRRVYDEPAAYSLLGYVSPLKFGLSGLEASLDEELTGAADTTVTSALERSLLGRAGATSTAHLSIDIGLQRIAADLLDGSAGSAVVLECATGRILAMASAPTIDPNRLSAVDGESAAAAQDYWDTVLADPGRPLLSRATTGLYPPGSTFKVVTTAAAVELGIATPDSMYEDNGELLVDGRRLLERNRPDESRDEWSLSEGLAYSLNLVYAQVGLDLGAERLSRWATAFGIGQAVPLELPTRAGQIASSPDFLDSKSAVADTAIGQGELLATPLHMALVAAAVARDGTLPIPSLVDGVAADGAVSPHGAAVWKRAMTAETAAVLDQMMVDSATYGYARTAAVDGLRIGAKTGTAESGGDVPHSWFIGYRSDLGRPVAVSVCVDFGGEGGGIALEIGRELLRAV